MTRPQKESAQKGAFQGVDSLDFTAAALELAADWCVFPLFKNEKRPRTTHGLKDATNDASAIREWWRERGNIGIALPADLFVLDVDMHDANGRATLTELEAAHGALPRTRTTETPSGGLHLYFRKPAELKVKNRAGIRPGIDTRSAGGYVVAPPSTINGKAYRWLDDGGIADAPQWLLDLVTEQKEASAPEAAASQIRVRDAYAQRAIERATNEVLSATNGARNDTLNRNAYGLARLAAAGRLDWQQTSDHLARAATAAGLAEDEAAKTLQSAYDSGGTKPNYDGLPSEHPNHWQGWDVDNDTGEIVQRGPIFEEVSIADVITNPSPPPRFVWRDYVPRGKVTLLGAHGGTGKSMVALMLAVAVATGSPLFDVETERASVLFASLEDDADVLRHRLAWICKAWAIDPAVLTDLRIVDGTATPELFIAERRDSGETTATYAELQTLANGAGLVVIDNASDAYGGDEIQRRQVRAFIRKLAEIAKANDAAVLLLAHVDKNTSRSRSAEGGEGYSGSTAWNNTVRSRLFMVRNPDDTITLAHQKGNLSAGLRDPLTLEWPKDGLPCARHALSPVVQGVADKADTRALLRLIHEFTERGEHVAAKFNSQTGATRVLSAEPTYPHRKENEVTALLRNAQRDGYLTAETVATQYRNKKDVWRVTPAGKAYAGIAAAEC